MTWNKVYVVAQGYSQKRGIEYDEAFAPVPQLESIWMLYVYTCLKDFFQFQVDVKCIFLNGLLKEKVYIEENFGILKDLENFLKIVFPR